ncbi:MAG TPA: site-specific DNA-methyltransferase [Candidatus Xenobia bacterium]|nr:site-specific DNA-methyltransferase [Candidatus Xenobia bacterium]
MPDTNLEKFKKLLAELFMFDQADLDFGIYRIMNAKRDEINRFLDNDLLPQVRQALGELEQADRAAIEAELAKAIEQARALGADPESLPKVKELRQQLAQKADVEALESEVFSDLYNFFRRYYNEGDFLSLRRYKEGVYAIPYEGEEVKLYWANHDQYYIKTTEYFRDYTFKLPDGRRVHFKLAEAGTEQNNNKPASGQERRFVLGRGAGAAGEQGDRATGGQGEIWDIVDGELVIYFRFVPDPEKRKQADLNGDAAQKIRECIAQSASLQASWSSLLEKRPTEKNPDRTLLEKRLADYTARNTFDYFIHKDLGGFLRRELDFYIKNEVMHLDDIESESAPRVEQYLARVRAIRRIAHKIIDFLAQLENFQKKLWLKKKFVIETNYCITLDRVPEELYPEIAANEAQREEWVKLLAIDDIKQDLARPGYSVPLTVEFLKANKFLVLDTKHFGEDFKARLLHSITDLDEQLDGLLIHSENFQALKLLNERYEGQIKCTYIDPPYNTGNDRFVYKDRYQHSSWLAMMGDRLALMTELMLEDGAIFVSIDGNERDRLKNLADVVLGPEHYLNTFVWINNLKGRQISGRGAAGTHEYVLAFGGSHVATFVASVVKFKDVMPSAYKGFDYEAREDEGGLYVLKNELYNTNSRFNEETRPNLVFNIHYNFTTREIRFSDVCDDVEFAGFVKIPPKLNNDGVHRYHAWRWGREKILKFKADLEFVQAENQVRIYTKVRRFQTTVLKDVITDIDTSAGGEELFALFGVAAFVDYPKPVSFVEVFASQAAEEELIGDFFAGSGTTGHAVINLNREDGGRRKYILVEMGEYFDTVLVPRIKKVVYSKDWKDGKPVSREGISHMFKYIRLESYEDTLNNLELKRTREQGELLERHPAMREDYVLRYMLDVESQGSASLLNLDRFEDPFNYKLKVSTGSAGETRLAHVDLVETFNWLLGLRVKHMDTIRGFRVVQGTNPAGEKVLVIWRNTREKSNSDLDEFFLKQGYNTRDMEFDLIYVNGDNNLENLKRPDETWKVRLIEEEFKRLMFDVQDV